MESKPNFFPTSRHRFRVTRAGDELLDQADGAFHDLDRAAAAALFLDLFLGRGEIRDDMKTSGRALDVEGNPDPAQVSTGDQESLRTTGPSGTTSSASTTSTSMPRRRGAQHKTMLRPNRHSACSARSNSAPQSWETGLMSWYSCPRGAVRGTSGLSVVRVTMVIVQTFRPLSQPKRRDPRRRGAHCNDGHRTLTTPLRAVLRRSRFAAAKRAWVPGGGTSEAIGKR